MSTYLSYPSYRSYWYNTVMQTVPREFYTAPTIEVAKKLLGKVLVHRIEKGVISGRIVETEAYTCDDPACHASRGMTKRNAAMFGEAGHAYVYFTYGMYFCFNVVTGHEGVGEAVLIRAAEPLEGIELMKVDRGTDDVINLASGPGKLCQAFAINRDQNGLDLTNSELMIVDDGWKPAEIITSTRIGIRLAADRPWRFYVSGNPYVSRK